MIKEQNRYYDILKKLYNTTENCDGKKQRIVSDSKVFDIEFIDKFNDDEAYVFTMESFINHIKTTPREISQEYINRYCDTTLLIKSVFNFKIEEDRRECQKYLELLQERNLYDDARCIAKFIFEIYPLFESKKIANSLIENTKDLITSEYHVNGTNDLTQEIINYIKAARSYFKDEEIFSKVLKFYNTFLLSDKKGDKEEQIKISKKDLQLMLEKELEFNKSIKDESLDSFSAYMAQRKIYLCQTESKKIQLIAEDKKIISPPKVKSIVLNQYASDMMVTEFITNPAISREKELEKLELAIISPKSAILLGNPGVGKTAIVEGLVYNLKNGKVPSILKDRKVFDLKISSFMAGARYVGDPGERITQLVKELQEHKDIIVFIDEIHTIVGSGAGEVKSNDIANMLKPYLDRNSIKIIGATTKEEYEKYIAKDRALSRRFYPITIEEPSIEDTKKILNGSIPRIEQETGVQYKFNPDETNIVLTHLIETSAKENQNSLFITSRPELPLTLLQIAFSYAALSSSKNLRVEDLYNSIYYEDKLNTEKRQEYAKQLVKKIRN